MLRSPRAPSGPWAAASSRLRAASAQSPRAHCAAATLNSTWEPGGRWGTARTRPRPTPGQPFGAPAKPWSCSGPVPCPTAGSPPVRPPHSRPQRQGLRVPGSVAVTAGPSTVAQGSRPPPFLGILQACLTPVLHPAGPLMAPSSLHCTPQVWGAACSALSPAPSRQGKGLWMDTWDWGKARSDPSLLERLPRRVPHQGLLAGSHLHCSAPWAGDTGWWART